MEFLGWIGWLILKVVGVAWGIVWFLLGGWVATLAQIAVIVLVIFGYKYGWRRAPAEAMLRLAALGRLAWGWIRVREVAASAPVRPARPSYATGPRRGRPREVGDVNLSTMLSLLMLAGLALALAV